MMPNFASRKFSSFALPYIITLEKLKAIKINNMQMNCLQLCFNISIMVGKESFSRALPGWGDFNIAPRFNS